MVKPSNRQLYIGKSKLDQEFLEIIDGLPEGTNFSEFIKQTIVDMYRQKTEGLDLQKIKKDIKTELKAELMEELKKYRPAVQPEPEPETPKQSNEEIEKLADSFLDSF